MNGMINFYEVIIRVNGFITSTRIIAKENPTILEYEKRVKDSYYGGRKNWRLKDKFDIKEFIVIKEKLGL
jgi:hypothetical protein